MLGGNGAGGAGGCWTCKILPVKVLGSNGSGSSSNVAAGIVWAADNGADIISLSLGCRDRHHPGEERGGLRRDPRASRWWRRPGTTS